MKRAFYYIAACCAALFAIGFMLVVGVPLRLVALALSGVGVLNVALATGIYRIGQGLKHKGIPAVLDRTSRPCIRRANALVRMADRSRG